MTESPENVLDSILDPDLDAGDEDVDVDGASAPPTPVLPPAPVPTADDIRDDTALVRERLAALETDSNSDPVPAPISPPRFPAPASPEAPALHESRRSWADMCDEDPDTGPADDATAVRFSFFGRDRAGCAHGSPFAVARDRCRFR